MASGNLLLSCLPKNILPAACCPHQVLKSINLKKHFVPCRYRFSRSIGTSQQFSISLDLLVNALMKLTHLCLHGFLSHHIAFQAWYWFPVICGREMLCGLCRNGSNCFLCVQTTVFHFLFLCGKGQKRERMPFAFLRNTSQINAQKRLLKYVSEKREGISNWPNGVMHTL